MPRVVLIMELHNDKVADFLDACHRAGIKDPFRFLESKRPQVYDWLKGVFPRGCLPTDIDGELELNGYFLRLEFKDEKALRHGYVAKGQRLALSRLVETKRFTVVLIGVGDFGEPTCWESYSHDGKHSKLRDTTKEKLREYFKRWAAWAESPKKGQP